MPSSVALGMGRCAKLPSCGGWSWQISVTFLYTGGAVASPVSCCSALLVACGHSGDSTPDGACVDVMENDASCGSLRRRVHRRPALRRRRVPRLRASSTWCSSSRRTTPSTRYFGRYCQAPAGSNPTCTTGPACCERAPDTEPRGAAPIVLDDSANFAEDRDHLQACELQQIDGGKMDNFVTGASGADTCAGSGPRAPARTTSRSPARARSAPTGRSPTPARSRTATSSRSRAARSANDMYLAIAHYQFIDNEAMPDAIGNLLDCTIDSVCLSAARTKYTGRTTIADLLLNAGKTFKVYADGYAEAAAAGYGNCPNIASDCQYSELAHPIAYQACRYDASRHPVRSTTRSSQTARTSSTTRSSRRTSRTSTLPELRLRQGADDAQRAPERLDHQRRRRVRRGHDPDDRAVSVRELDARSS